MGALSGSDMMWMALRAGWGNTAAIVALGLLPLVSLAGAAFDAFGTDRVRPIPTHFEQVALGADLQPADAIPD